MHYFYSATLEQSNDTLTIEEKPKPIDSNLLIISLSIFIACCIACAIYWTLLYYDFIKNKSGIMPLIMILVGCAGVIFLGISLIIFGNNNDIIGIGEIGIILCVLFGLCFAVFWGILMTKIFGIIAG